MASTPLFDLMWQQKNALANGDMSQAQQLDQQMSALSAGAPQDPYLSTSPGNNENGAAYDALDRYDWAQNNNLTPTERGAEYEAASKGTAQVRNPYDYVIGHDRDYVNNMSAQAQALGQQTQQGYQGLQAQANQAQQTGATMMGMGGAAADYGQTAAQGINAGAGRLATSAGTMMSQGNSARGRLGPELDFGQQNSALNRAGMYANQLAGMQQGPSGAQAMLQSGANQSMAQSLALARSGRGFGGSAAGQAQALQQNASTMQNVANQSALLRAQEDQAWRAQRAQNLAQASNLYQGAGNQYAQQQALGAQTALQGRAQNDAYSSQLYGLGLQGQQAALGAQAQAAQTGLSGLQTGANIYGQGAQVQQQGTQLEGALLGQGAQAASQGMLNDFGFQSAQNQADMSRENMVTQDYGIRSGVGISNAQMQQQQNAALYGAIGTGAGMLIGSFAGPGGTAAGGAAGGYAGQAAASDERVKRDVHELPDMGRTYASFGGPAAAAGVPRRDVDYASLDAADPYRALAGPPPLANDLRPAQGYTYEYKDPQRFGQGEFAGPMAQDLEKSPATAGTVYTDPTGVKKIDTSRLALVNTSAISEQQRRIDELERALNEYEVGRKRGVASDKRTKKNIKPLSSSRQPSSDPEEPPVSLQGYGFGYGDYFRDTSAPGPRASLEHPRLVEQQRAAEGERRGRFDKLDAIPYDQEAAKAEVSPGRSFARSAVATALDTAALPVRAAGAGAEALGYPNAAAHLDGRRAAEDLEWLYSRRDPADIRAEESVTQADMPQAAWAGDVVGGMVGGAPLGAVTARLNPAVGSVIGAIKRKPRTVTREDADALRAAENNVFRKGMSDADYSRLLGENKRVGGNIDVRPLDENYVAISMRDPNEVVRGEYRTHVMRSFERGDDGKLVANHGMLTLPEHLEGRGIGSDMLRQQAEQYQKMGVDEIHTQAIDAGRVVWPKLGYELKNRDSFPRILKGAEQFSGKRIAASNLEELARTPEGAAYLQSKAAPESIDLVATPDSILRSLPRKVEPAKDRARLRIAAADRGDDRVPRAKGDR